MQLFYCLWLVFSVVASIEAVPRRLNPQCRSNVCDDRPECPRTSCACIFPSRMDCAVYYQCVNGKPFQYKCSPGLLFNSETLSCDYSYNVDCGFNTNYTSSTAALNTTTSAPLTTTVTAEIKSTTGITEEITTSDTSTAVASTTSEGTTTEVTEKISTADETTTEAATSRPSSVPASTDKEITTTERVTTLQTETTKVSTSKATTAETTIDTTTEASTPSTTEKHTTVKTTSKAPTTTTPVAETTTTEVLTTSSIFTTTTESPSTSKYPLVTNSSVISTESEGVSTSNPSSSEFLCPTRFGLFPDPKSCYRFYHCSHWTPYHKWCPSNLHFNPILKVCDWPYRAGCDSSTPDVTGTPTLHPDITPRTPKPNKTSEACDCEYCELPVPSDCSAYVLCINHVATLMHCAQDLYFNPMTGTCDLRENVVCIEDSVQCPVPSGRFLVEGSCSYFLECHNGNKTLKKCPEGLQFNQSSEMCSWLGSCAGGGLPDDQPAPGIIADFAPCESCDYCYKPFGEDCSQYVKCIYGYAIEGRCAAGLFFNPDTQMCDHSYNVQCPVPEPRIECPERFGYFPYPGDCGTYLHCINGRAELKECPGILHFDPLKKHCDWPWTAGCNDSDSRPTPVPDAETSDCDCDCCLKPAGTDCRSFTLCINHVGFKRSCSSGLHFNPHTENCDFAENVDCSTNPDIPGYQCPEYQGLFPHPEDCEKFIHCAHGFPHVKDCPSNLHFNPTLKVCDWPYSAGCQGIPPSEPPPIDNDLPCDVCDSCFIPDESDCASYIYCRNGTGRKLRCTENLVFNPDSETCDLRSNVNCPSQPTSQCSSPDGLFAAKDCSQFIHCSNGIAYLKDCPDGLHFNPQILVCDWPENVKCGETPVLPTLPPQPNDDDDIFNKTCNCDCCFLPHEKDCSKYILCLDGLIHVGQCSRGLLFNPLLQNCDFAERVTCGDTSPLCPEPNGLFPNGEQCSSYLICSNGIAHVEYCQNGKHFSAESKQCLDPCKAECDRSYNCESPFPSTSTTTVVPSSTTLSPYCLEKDGLFGNKNNCSLFYQCSGGRAHVVTCPPGLHFSDERKVCDYPCAAKCDSSIDCNPSTPSSTTLVSSTTTLSPHCLESNGIFPNTDDCTSFYQCSDGRAYLILCPSGLHFSDEHKVCEYPCDAKCNATIDCSPSSTASTAPSTTTLSPHCYEKDGLFPNKDDCTSFYECSSGRAYLKKCPSGLHFSSAHRTCEYPCEAKCNVSLDCSTTTPRPVSSTPSPHCPTPNGIHPVPGVCTAFYLCSNGKEYLISCPPGLHFSEEHEICEDPCLALCNTSVDCSSSTASTAPSTTTISPHCYEKDGIFPNEDDCTSFYECSSGRAYLKRCPSGLHFSTAHKACEYPCEAKCNSSIDCSTTTPQVITSTPSPHCPTPYGIHPVPGDCTSFYLCSNGKEYLIPCPPGLHFSEQHEICEDPCIALCNTSVDCSSSTASTAPSTTTISPHCYEKDGIFPNEDDCTSFYECSSGRAYLKTCPSGLHFSTAHKACEYPCEAKCNISLDCSTTTPQVISSTPSPHCPSPNGIHPVPGDCTSFYLCSNGKEYLIPCPPGLHFSEQHEICEDPCIALCNTSADCGTSVKPSSSTPPTWTPECKEPDGLFPNPDDCETFYECSNGQSQLFRCPSGLHFSLDDSACERPCVAGCNISIECPPEVPDTKGNCTCDGCYLPDPNDCSAFYFCDKSQLTKSYCPFGTLFSKISSTCENEDDVDCESNGDPSMCPEPYGFFPYPGDCKKFIHCDNSVAHVKECQDDLEYDPIHRVCTKPRGYCGDIVPDPHCLEPTGMFPDPTDCSLFYHCEHGVAYPKTCSSPLMFNPDKQVCDWPGNVDCGKDAQSTSTTTVSTVPSKTTVNISTTTTSISPSKTTVNISTTTTSTSPSKTTVNNTSTTITSTSPSKTTVNNTSTTMSTTPAPPPVDECHVVPGVVCPCACRVPTYDECSSYYQCQEDGTACKKFCPEGLFFNKIEMVCDLPENVACRDFFFTSIRRAKLFSHRLR